MPDIKIGSSDANTGGEVTRWQQWFQRYARSYAPPIDGYVGNADVTAIRLLQTNLARSGKSVVIDGVFGDRTQAAVGYKWKGAATPPVVKPRRPIWVYTAPGSGAPGNVGPSFQTGERAKRDLNLNHQWIGYPIGGYLGFMGGDPTFSYLDICQFLDIELERLLWLNPDVIKAMAARKINPTDAVDVELWFSGYSQSADALRRSLARLFGPGGPFEVLRDRINGVINFGDPSTPKTGISGLTFDTWLERLVTDINYPNDFYAVASDKIRRAMFKIIVQAEMSLPFFVHVMKIAIKVIPKWLPIFGGILGPLAPLVIAGAAGVGSLSGLLGGFMGQASGADEEVDKELEELFSMQGLITGLPDILGLISALPGLQAHGGYEFDAVMMNKAFDTIARFRR